MIVEVIDGASISQLLLYTNGPFYASPWRAPLNSALGSDYASAFRHFDRDHTDAGHNSSPERRLSHLHAQLTATNLELVHLQ